jgi:hypothetical protein
LIGQTVTQQATLLAYIDIFALFAMIAVLLAPLALVLLRAHAPKGARPAH